MILLASFKLLLSIPHPLAIFTLIFVSFVLYCIIYFSVQQEEKRLTTKEELEDARLSRHKLEQYVISYLAILSKLEYVLMHCFFHHS